MNALVMVLMEFFATTVAGLEDIAAREVEELTGVKAYPDVGKVLFSAGIREAATLNYAAKTLHKIFLLLTRCEVETLDDIERAAREVDYSQLISPGQSFAIRAERHGEHPFISPQVAARVGHAVIESYKASKGVRLRVNLNEPDVEIYALVRGRELFLGLNTTGNSLHRRYYRVWHHRAAILPTIASAMIELSGWRRGQVFLDPFCGGATIPIEAALRALRIAPGLRTEQVMRRLIIFDEQLLVEIAQKLEQNEERLRGEALSIYAADASSKALEGADANIKRAGLGDVIKVRLGDARYISKWLDTQPDVVVTNPPFGVRLGLSNPELFYVETFKALAGARVSRITLLANKLTVIRRSLESAGWSIVNQRNIIYGTLTAAIFTAER